MRNLILAVCLCCTLCFPVFAATKDPAPPKPVQGSPSFISKSLTTQSGDYAFDFKFPPGWGMGQMRSSPDGSGDFLLFPTEGGYGCKVEIIPFENAQRAKEALENQKLSFKSPKALKTGFEVELPKAWYACYVEGAQLVQIWYSLPKKTKESESTWAALKESLSISHGAKKAAAADKPKASSPVPKAYSPVTEESLKGWWCHHPNNKLHVLFESSPHSNAQQLMTTLSTTSSRSTISELPASSM